MRRDRRKNKDRDRKALLYEDRDRKTLLGA